MFIKNKGKKRKQRTKTTKKERKIREKIKKEKKINQSKIEKEQRKIEKENKFFGPNNVWTMYGGFVKRKGNNSNLVRTWRDRKWSPKLLTKSSGLLSYSTQNKRGKAKPTKKNYLQSPTLESPIDPWWLCILSLVWWEMTSKINLWHICDFELRQKHLPIHLVRFSSVRLNPVFLLNVLLETKY